jgi:hypothetical protein
MEDLFYFTLKLLFLLFRNQSLFLSEGDVILSLKVPEARLCTGSFTPCVPYGSRPSGTPTVCDHSTVFTVFACGYLLSCVLICRNRILYGNPLYESVNNLAFVRVILQWRGAWIFYFSWITGLSENFYRIEENICFISSELFLKVLLVEVRSVMHYFCWMSFRAIRFNRTPYFEIHENFLSGSHTEVNRCNAF